MSAPRAELDAQLADLASALDAPRGDGVAAAVAARLRAEGGVAPAVADTVVRNGGMRRWLVALGAAVAAAAVAFVAAPAVADWLGVRGVEVRPPVVVPVPTTATVPPNGVRFDLGTFVPSLAAAESAAGFAPAVPGLLGAPDAVWVDDRGSAPFISLVYDDGPLVTEFDATISDDAVVRKQATPETTVERLEVRGEPALWITGLHEVAVRTREGSYVFERLRLSDRVLLVQHGPLTVRIEPAPGTGRDDAIRIAESLPR